MPKNFCNCGRFIEWKDWAAHRAYEHPNECDHVCRCDRPCAMGKGHAPGKIEDYGSGAHRCEAWAGGRSCF